MLYIKKKKRRMRILSTVFFLSLLAGKLTAFEHIFTYRINRQNLRLPYEKHLFLSFRRENSTVPWPNHIFLGKSNKIAR